MNHEPDILAKVRKILAKAEDPAATPEEAETYTAKAAELIAAYGIDRALLAETDARLRRGRRPGGPARRRRTRWTRPGCSAASPTGCGAGRCAGPVRRRREADLAPPVRLRLGPGPGRDALHQPAAPGDQHRWHAPRCRTASHVAAYRRSWLAGFTAAVSRRLAEAEDRAQTPRRVGRDQGARSVALVLADRSLAVSQAVEEEYPVPAQGGRPHAVGQRRTLRVDRRAARRPRRHPGDPTLARAGRRLSPA